MRSDAANRLGAKKRREWERKRLCLCCCVSPSPKAGFYDQGDSPAGLAEGTDGSLCGREQRRGAKLGEFGKPAKSASPERDFRYRDILHKLHDGSAKPVPRLRRANARLLAVDRLRMSRRTQSSGVFGDVLEEPVGDFARVFGAVEIGRGDFVVKGGLHAFL
jgi:hypothetical protein